jgi:tRNA1Val (adenine37-N6)-methyltransferase
VAQPLTRDALFGGAVMLWQPARGYRVNADAILLAAFARAGGGRVRRVLDLGAGVGALGLAFVHFGGTQHIDAVENDPKLAELCARNLAEAGIDGRVIEADVAKLPRSMAGSTDLVLCNPPFFEPGERRPAHASREGARAGALAPFVAAAARALGPGRSRAAFVYPARTLSRLLGLAEARGLAAKRMRLVHPFAEQPARVALVEFKRAKPGGLVVEAPLVEWQKRGVRSEEVARLVR